MLVIIKNMLKASSHTATKLRSSAVVTPSCIYITEEKLHITAAISAITLIADIISSSITGPNTLLNDCSMSQRKLCSPLSFLIFNTLQSLVVPVSVMSHTPRHACLLKDLMQVFRALNLLHTSRHSHNSSNTSISI
nr:unnamed protein product [Callosobruchus analis]